ncbi:MAG: cellulose biosynthesis protein BcsG [Steroidobacteraceae bacterium]
MGFWNVYFICKIALHLAGSIALHPWFNLALAAVLLLPLPRPALRLPRQIAAVVAAVALLYYESFLPPFRSLISQAGAVTGFSLDYLGELVTRVVEPHLVVWLVLLVAVYTVLTRWLRVTSFVLLALLVVPFLPLPRAGSGATAPVGAVAAAPSPYARVDDGSRLTASTTPAELERAVDRFFAREERRTLAFPPVTQDVDIIMIQVCSLAWADLNAIGQQNHPLLSRFDVLFTNFNSAASYSGPAAIRLLRGTCGQEPHDALYDPVAPECQLMTRLQQAGFRPQLLMNHDGHFGNFRSDVAGRGGLDVAPQPTGTARVTMQSFDGTPITGDYDTLHDWWQRRRAGRDPRVALYYNTISLHDGNRLPEAGGWLKSYPRRARRLLDDLDRFIGELEGSGARAIVVVIPEHGAAYHATPGGIAGLRQVPGPDVTLVPVGVRLVGLPLQATSRPLRVEASTSYLGLNQFLANVMTAVERNSGPIALRPLVAQLHATPFVAEHDGLMVVRAGEGYYLRSPDRRWKAETFPVPGGR